jgi:signal transduction histidine kinase
MKTFGFTSRVLKLALWLLAALIAIAGVAAFQYRAGVADLQQWADETDTLLAEKLGQHDAHMTALAAVIRMSPEEPSASVQGLAHSITSFYPRIAEISTIRIAGDNAHVTDYGKADGPVAVGDMQSAALPALGRPGETAIRPLEGQSAYEIYKLVEPGRQLRLRIDAAGLVGTDRVPPDYALALSLGDARLFARAADGIPLLTATTGFSVGNAAQPLHLDITRGFTASELLPLRLLLPLLLALAAMLWLVTQYRNASRERRRQELRATLLEQEARLAHAGRVNALGEMASGIAHELAQPVAAMLSQSQAARRALAQARQDILEQALDANIREAKRAGDILGRMRAYISGAEARMEPMRLDEALSGAIRLIEADLAARGIGLDISIAEPSCRIAIDVISFQQVIHNLIRNAADALAGRPDPLITLRARQDGGQAVITIADNGPGIEPAALDRIFDPFFTTKPDGMGLGLPLSARLIEKMDGTLEAENDGGARFTIRLPAQNPAGETA